LVSRYESASHGGDWGRLAGRGYWLRREIHFRSGGIKGRCPDRQRNCYNGGCYNQKFQRADSKPSIVMTRWHFLAILSIIKGCSISDEQRDLAVIGFAEEGSHAAEFDTIKQIALLNTHQVDAHLAGHNFDPVFHRHLD
jgi:hypothetical protein